MDDNLPWIEKYRPASLNDVSGHEGVIKTIRRFVENKQIPHLLFYGPPGTGKTSTIVAVAREIYGPNYKNMVLELNASDDRGIDVVRNEIKTFASTQQIFSKGFKLVILDEADAMTNVAQNALRRIIEKYSAHTRFCIIANYTHKLNPALISRCTRFRFSPLTSDAVRSRCQDVIAAESIAITPTALDALVTLAHGDMRRALNVLQACHAWVERGTPIDEKDIYDCVGSPDPRDVQRILTSMLKESWSTAYDVITTLKRDKGLALADILQCLTDEVITLELDQTVRGKILSGMAEIEWRLSSGGTEKIQTSALIGVINEAVH